MNAALWGMQGFLALVFLGTGLVKLTQPTDTIRKLIPPPFSMSFVRALGALEVAGAVGIIVPWLTGILPVFTPIAAIAMGVVAMGAVILHIREREAAKVPFVGTLLILALIVAYGRFALIG